MWYVYLSSGVVELETFISSHLVSWRARLGLELVRCLARDVRYLGVSLFYSSAVLRSLTWSASWVVSPVHQTLGILGRERLRGTVLTHGRWAEGDL